MAYGFNDDKSKVELSKPILLYNKSLAVLVDETSVSVPNQFSLDPNETGLYTPINYNKKLNTASKNIVTDWGKGTLFGIEMSAMSYAQDIKDGDIKYTVPNYNNRLVWHGVASLDTSSSDALVFGYYITSSLTASGSLYLKVDIKNIKVASANAVIFNILPLAYGVSDS